MLLEGHCMLQDVFALKRHHLSACCVHHLLDPAQYDAVIVSGLGRRLEI